MAMHDAHIHISISKKKSGSKQGGKTDIPSAGYPTDRSVEHPPDDSQPDEKIMTNAMYIRRISFGYPTDGKYGFCTSRPLAREGK